MWLSAASLVGLVLVLMCVGGALAATPGTRLGGPSTTPPTTRSAAEHDGGASADTEVIQVPKPTTIDDYIRSAPEEGRRTLEQLRALCRDTAPHTAEQLKWGHPAYLHPDGVILFMFSAHKAHASFAVTPSTRAAFSADLVGFRTGKGTVALPYDASAPLPTLRKMIEFRIREYEDDGVKWM